MNVYIEMLSGCQSRGYDPEDFTRGDESIQDCAERVFDSVVSQLSAWKGFSVDVVMLNNISVEVRRHHVEG